MPLDYVYYCDFSKEIPLADWELMEDDGKTFSMRKKITTEGGDFIFLSSLVFFCTSQKEYPCATSLTANGKKFFPNDRLAYVKEGRLRNDFSITLPPGEVELVVEGKSTPRQEWREHFFCALARPQESVSPNTGYHAEFRIEEEPLPAPLPEPDLSGFRPGIGTEKYKGPGRFGYSKGDGVLDCAMTSLGNIDKLYLLGHPEYKKTFRWNYTTLPKGAPRYGSYFSANAPLDDTKITINHISCHWEAEIQKTPFACTYSLATPGIITENASGLMRIGDLEFAGNYQYMMIPRRDGSFEVSSIRDVKELDMGANYLLLFGCTEFPDLPLLLVFQEKPEKMELTFDPLTSRLTEITFTNCPLIITATPFGFESFQPIAPDDQEFLAKAVKKCRFWSRAFLAYPIACEEHFKIDEEKESVTILQKFSYRYIQDAWGTVPLETAPIPPVASLNDNTHTEGILDLGFPTKFGYLQGAIGANSSYTIPFMPPYRKFPLKESSDTKLSSLLKEGMESYFKVVSAFPETVQSYPYAGALVEPFALTSTQMQFMDQEDREKLRSLLEKRLETACDPDHSYDYPVIVHSHMMKTMPDDEEVIRYTSSLPRKRLYNWYERVEPFTGTSFTICYLNVGLFSLNILNGSNKEEVRDLRIPLIENDWGVGLTFYYMYLAALASGSFKPIRERWDLLKNVYSFFVKMHDWACMGTGYSDNAILWVEGANYGAFTSFIHMAKAVEDEETYQFAQYMAAKQFVLRSAVFRSSQHYFHKYYNVEPYYITKIMEEEQNISFQHAGVPLDLGPLRFRADGIYNLTTEGIYPEIFEGFLRLMPGETRKVMDLLLEYNKILPDRPQQAWHFTQQFASLLTYMALSPDFTREDLDKTIALAREKHCWMGKWRGIHIFSRRLPEHFFETLLYAWDASKHHPCTVVHHQEILLDESLWTGEKALLKFRLAGKGGKALVKFEIQKDPGKILLNGREVEGKKLNHILEIPLPEGGTLELLY